MAATHRNTPALGAADAIADHKRARNIDLVHLEDRLRNIQTNCANLAHGRLPSMWFASTEPPYGASMPKSGHRPQHQTLQVVCRWAVPKVRFGPSPVTHASRLCNRAE